MTDPAFIFHWEMVKNLLEFGDLDSSFNATDAQRMLENVLSALKSPEGMDGTKANLHQHWKMDNN